MVSIRIIGWLAPIRSVSPEQLVGVMQHDEHVIEWCIEQVIRKYGRQRGVRLERE